MAQRSTPKAHGLHTLLDAGQRLTGHIGEGVGYVSAALLVVLTLSVLLGIAMRSAHIDNSWTYDVDLFALVWVAFVGAAYTAMRGEHVTSGVAIENVLPRWHNILQILRFVIVAVFLVVFMVSGYVQFLDSVQAHETTLDVMSWPVWVATLALPTGALLWLVAEIHHALLRLAARRN